MNFDGYYTEITASTKDNQIVRSDVVTMAADPEDYEHRLAVLREEYDALLESNECYSIVEVERYG